jgi:hypothetical protein
MAKEITINLTASLNNPSTTTTAAVLKDTFQPGSVSVNQATQLMFAEAITCTTADTAITFTGVTTQGYCMLQNLDTTNYVTFGPASAGAIVNFMRLKAGECAVFRLDPSCTFRVQANTASCKVLIKVYND